MGFDSVFQFDIGLEVEPQYYWHIVILGILLGLLGAFYNKMTLWVQGLYKKNKSLNETTRLLIPFLLAGVLGLVMPEILGSGHHLIDQAASGSMVLPALLFLLWFRSAWGHLLPTAGSGSLNWRGLQHLCSRVSGAGCLLYQQFCTPCHGRIFYRYCESAYYRNYSDF